MQITKINSKKRENSNKPSPWQDLDLKNKSCREKIWQNKQNSLLFALRDALSVPLDQAISSRMLKTWEDLDKISHAILMRVKPCRLLLPFGTQESLHCESSASIQYISRPMYFQTIQCVSRSTTLKEFSIFFVNAFIIIVLTNGVIIPASSWRKQNNRSTGMKQTALMKGSCIRVIFGSSKM